MSPGHWLHSGLRACLAASLVFAASHASTQTVAASAAAETASSPLAHLPLRRDDGGDAAQRATAAWSMLFVAVLALGAFWLVRTDRWKLRGRPGRAAGAPMPALDSIAQLRLQPQLTLHVVRWGSEEFLIAATPQQATLLARRSDRGPIEESA